MGNVIAKTSGDIASFMSPSVTNIKSLKVHFSPKQLGTGDPSPENVREIVGWDGVEVNRCGKNIAHIVGYSANVPASSDPSLRKLSNNYGTTISTTNFSLPDTKIIITQSSYTTEYDPVSYRNGYFAVVVDNLDFTKRYNVSFNVDDIINNPLNVDLSRIRAISPAGTGFEPPAKIDGNRLFFKNVPFTPHSNYPNRKSFEIRNAGMSFTLSEFMATPVDDEDFEYKPYQGTIDITNWSSDVGTVYGGYIDLISGELVEEYTNIRLNADTSCGEFRVQSNGKFTVWADVTGMKPSSLVSDEKALCNKAIKVDSYKDNKALRIKLGNNNSNIYLYNMNAIYNLTTIEQISMWLEENPIHVTVPLATPITHQLTPTQLSSFIGQNNFWSNADYVEIEYELKETEDIQKARKKIILNQPHIESIKDDLVNFTTNMKAPLKECKVYFEPVQEGSGDPSPDNVRNITGWDGVNVGLPSEYQEVEWIKSNGAQFIQLPFGFDDTDEIETVFSIEQPANDKYINAPSTWNNNRNRFGMGKHTGQGGLGQTFTAAYGTRMTGYTYLEPPTNPDYDLHKWTYKNHVFAIPELEISRDVSDIEFHGTTTNLKLFYGYNSNTIGKIRYYKHIKSDVSYHLIACYRKSDNEIGLYDIINNVFYTNDGTDAFAKGADVNNITTNISWTDEVGTIYGGYVDLVKGELVVTQVGTRKKLSEATSKVQNSNGVYQYNFNFAIPYGQILNKYGSQKCSICGYSWNMSDFQQNHFFGYYNESTGNRFLLFLLEDHGLNEDTEIDFMSELTSPVTFQLSPQQLLTLKGTNNIWSNSNGQIEVKFWTH